jgi:hypothetical protein
LFSEVIDETVESILMNSIPDLFGSQLKTAMNPAVHKASAAVCRNMFDELSLLNIIACEVTSDHLA